MLKWPALIIASALAAAVQMAFFSALPAPWNSIDLVLIAVLGLVAGFRPDHAYAVAIAAGLSRDIITSSPLGTNAIIAAAVAFTSVMLVERVITNLSFISFAALNAAGFILYGALAAGLHFAGAVTVGQPLDGAFSFAGTAAWLAGLLVQVAASLILLLAARTSKRAFRSRFFYTEHA